jgi:hypothetical protein
MVISSLILLLYSLVTLASGQSCENYGTQNGSGCACPPGFGGSTCSQPSCGGDIFQGSQRAVAPGGNLTAGNCACESGWIGAGCNVCQNAGACQSGYTKVTPNAGGLPSPSTSQTGQNDTLTCNTSSRVYAASQMSCQVIVSLSMGLDTTDFSDLYFRILLYRIYIPSLRTSISCVPFNQASLPSRILPPLVQRVPVMLSCFMMEPNSFIAKQVVAYSSWTMGLLRGAAPP